VTRGPVDGNYRACSQKLIEIPIRRHTMTERVSLTVKLWTLVFRKYAVRIFAGIYRRFSLRFFVVFISPFRPLLFPSKSIPIHHYLFISLPIHKPRHWIEVSGLLHDLAALPPRIEPVTGIALPFSLSPKM
jgi:hypothetical protein